MYEYKQTTEIVYLQLSNRPVVIVARLIDMTVARSAAPIGWTRENERGSSRIMNIFEFRVITRDEIRSISSVSIDVATTGQ